MERHTEHPTFGTPCTSDRASSKNAVGVSVTLRNACLVQRNQEYDVRSIQTITRDKRQFDVNLYEHLRVYSLLLRVMWWANRSNYRSVENLVVLDLASNASFE